MNFRYDRRQNMSIIYDMANAVIQPLPAKRHIVNERVEVIPEPGVREVPSCGRDKESRAVSIHLIHALLKRG
jgi:hypothetical protein